MLLGHGISWKIKSLRKHSCLVHNLGPHHSATLSLVVILEWVQVNIFNLDKIDCIIPVPTKFNCFFSIKILCSDGKCRQEQFEKSAAGRAARAQLQATAKQSANANKGEPVLKV